jgi:O-acetyl-ADP-ribose deacetylase (regulator of RNase III)
MKGHLFIAPGDITQLNAHAIAYSASSYLGHDGNLYASFRDHVPAFPPWLDNLRREHGENCSVGDTFWLPLGADHRPHGGVLVVSTGGEAADDKAVRAVRAALTTAVRRLRGEHGRTDRLLIALPAFRLGMGGDRSQRLRSASAQIRTALDFLAAETDVDAVFVTYTSTLYQIFLEARRQVLGPPPADAVRYLALEEALRAHECVLFLGAGVSRGAGLPDWNELIARLRADLGIKPNARVDYLDLAQWYRERFGAERLADVLRHTYGEQSRPTLAHYLLTALPVRHVITTNYDDLLERSLTAQKRYAVKVVRQEDVARTGQGGVYVVKLHGDVGRPEEIVLSRDDYDEFFHRRPAMALLLEGLLLNQTFFFVGYGLRDPNFRQIFARIARMLNEARRPAFATTFETGDDTWDYLTTQWRHKQLELIGIAGATQAEQEHHFLRFLDGLAERVTMQTPRLFLAPDVAVSEPLAPLRKEFVEGVGRELVAAVQRELSAADARYLAELVEFLAAQGWRPGPRIGLDLCRLCEHLAARLTDARERRRLLILALGAAEGFAAAQRVREQLAALEK